MHVLHEITHASICGLADEQNDVLTGNQAGGLIAIGRNIEDQLQRPQQCRQSGLQIDVGVNEQNTRGIVRHRHVAHKWRQNDWPVPRSRTARQDQNVGVPYVRHHG